LKGEGLAELVAAFQRHRALLAETNQLAAKRAEQGEAWLAATLRERFGSEGAVRAAAAGKSGSPFRRLGELASVRGKT